ncbi:MAG: sensor domain-containing protein [Micrococcales bacterium]|nr:sensor domain-containing protein [Micrococcales bacterium]
MTNTPAPLWPTQRGPRAALTQIGRDTGYLLVGLPLSIASFCILISGLSVSVGTAVIYVGVFLGAFTLKIARRFANLERRRLAWGGYPVPPPAIDHAPPGVERTPRGLTAWLASHYRSGQRWRELVHGLVAMPLACFTASFALAWWTAAAGGLTFWIWEPFVRAFGGADVDFGIFPHSLHLPVPNWFINLVIGFFCLVTLPWVLAGLARLHCLLAHSLLTPTSREQRRHAEQHALARTHAQAEAQSLRRLERDLHDGPQQRLIRLGMDLASATRRLDEGEANGARDLLEQARSQTDAAIAELRALSRGIAPPVLADRGLAAALTALAAGAPLPVDLALALPPAQRWPESAETTIYFSVCEALANAAKHSGANHARVDVALGDRVLVATVTDDGAGGATAIPGHGLAGLAARVTSVGGTMTLRSDPGAGTQVVVMAPCG